MLELTEISFSFYLIVFFVSEGFALEVFLGLGVAKKLLDRHGAVLYVLLAAYLLVEFFIDALMICY